MNAATVAITGSCGHARLVVLSVDPQRAATEIEQLASSPCRACQPPRPSTRRITWADAR